MIDLNPTISERLIKRDPSLEIHNEGEWSKTDLLYDAFNDAGVECEVGEFLYAMVRILKPEFVLETGTHWGIGASYIALALEDNNQMGMLDTIEFQPPVFEKANKRFQTMGFENIRQYDCDARNFTPPEDWCGSNESVQDIGKPQPRRKYGMILLDTEPQTRFEELLRFYPYLEFGGYVFIHDLHRHMQQIPNDEHGFAWPFGEIPQMMKDLVKADHLRPFHFPTPRGLTGFYKVHPDDYQWERSRAGTKG